MLWSQALQAHFGAAGPQPLLLDLYGTLIDSVPDLTSAGDATMGVLSRAAAVAAEVSRWVGNGAGRLIRPALCDGDENAARALPAAAVQPARALFDQAYLQALHQATGAYAGVDECLQRLQQ